MSRNYIVSHTSYIDTRITKIQKSIPLDESILLTILRYVAKDQATINECCQPVYEAIDELRELFSDWDILQKGDFLGYLYQQMQTDSSRKKKGQFFTPPAIVHEMLNVIDEYKDPSLLRILDPACGAGQFLLASFSKLVSYYVSQGLTRKDAAEKTVQNNLSGFDIDPVAIYISRKNLSIVSGVPFDAIQVYQKNFLIRDEFDFRDGVSDNHQWNLVVGNPPWGSRISADEKQYYRHHYYSAQSGINTFTLFIERSLDVLAEYGKLSFLIPEAYLNIKAHNASRQHILNTTAIEKITLWGEQFKNVFAPSLSMQVRFEKDSAKRFSNVIKIRNGKDPQALLIPQHYYSTTHQNIFSIHYSRKSVELLQQIHSQDLLYLKNNARFYLGIVTGNNTDHIKPEQSEEFPDPIVVGKDLEPYKISFSNNYFRYDKSKLQQVAPKELYLTQNKLLYRFIGKRLTFALDDEGQYSLNNVNGLIPSTNFPVTNEALLTVLNSRLMQYYYEKTFFTLKVLRNNIEKLPLKALRKRTQQKLVSLSKEAADANGSRYHEIIDTIDDVIFHEYNVSDSDAGKVIETSAGHAIDFQ